MWIETKQSLMMHMMTAALAVTSSGIANAQPTRAVQDGVQVFDESFGVLSDLVELSSGDLVLLDDLGDLLFRGRPRTGLMSEFVRKGSGPREAGYPVRLFALTGGGAVVVDAQNERWLVIEPNGDIGDFFRLGRDGEPSRVARRISGFVVADGDIIYEAITPDGREIVRWFSKDDRITSLAARQPRKNETRVPGGMVVAAAGSDGRRLAALPAPPDQWIASVDGFVAIVFQDPYRVSIIANDGSRVDGAPTPIQPVRVDARTRDALVRELKIQRGRQASPDGEYLWPETLPAFHTDRSQSLFFAPNGDVWVRRTVAAGSPPTFDVFTRQAVLSERVLLPEGARLVGFGDRAVYYVERDADDLEYLHRSQFDFQLR